RCFQLAAAFVFGGLAALTPQAHAQGGVPLWTNRYDEGFPTAIAVDNSANVFVTGSAFTLAYSSAGVPLWTNRQTCPSLGIALDGGGNVFVTQHSNCGSNGDYMTVGYSAAGVSLWTKIFQGARHPEDKHDNFPTAIAVDNSGNVFVTGESTDLT